MRADAEGCAYRRLDAECAAAAGWGRRAVLGGLGYQHGHNLVVEVRSADEVIRSGKFEIRSSKFELGP